MGKLRVDPDLYAPSEPIRKTERLRTKRDGTRSYGAKKRTVTRRKARSLKHAR